MVFSGLNIWNGVRKCQEEEVSTPCELALGTGAVTGCGAVSAGAGLSIGALTTGAVACSILFGAAGALWGVSWVATSYLVENNYISPKTQSLLLLLSGALLAAAIAVAGLALGLLSLPLIAAACAIGAALALTCAATLIYSLCSPDAAKYNETALGTLEAIRSGIKNSERYARDGTSDGGFPYSEPPYRYAVQKEKVDENIDYLISLIQVSSQAGRKVDLDTETAANGDIVVILKSELMR